MGGWKENLVAHWTHGLRRRVTEFGSHDRTNDGFGDRNFFLHPVGTPMWEDLSKMEKELTRGKGGEGGGMLASTIVCGRVCRITGGRWDI